VSVVSVTYARNLGPVEHLSAGEWTDDPDTGRVALCCARCAAVFDLTEFHRIDETGFVVPAVPCRRLPCGEFAYVRLQNWADPIVRAR
jgi:hypothetical protein